MGTLYVVGPGRIGGYVALRALSLGLAERVFLKGRDFDRTEGVAQDLREGFPSAEVAAIRGFDPPEPAAYTFLTFSTLRWSPALGVNDRWLEAEANLRAVAELAERADPARLGTIFVVSNPVDLVTRFAAERLKSPSVYGIGISVDEVRAARVARARFGIDLGRVPCVGEHGAGVVPLLSQVLPADALAPSLYDEVRREMFAGTGKVLAKVSIPFYGPMAEVDRILRALQEGYTGTISLSRVLDAPVAGVSGAALGVPVELDEGRPGRAVPFEMTPREGELFREAAARLDERYRRLAPAGANP